ncbi:UDP-glycosyltransferase 92A1-like protein [Carex littledalei]|uniref:UDP-glycosyltransferase 92A1-like protein n=1 Tax=Carex littledalei TaxID=544730 RepID=A0A833VLX0_9POAL|nr:UDP-glycosyltransferase 92A1-like protein [Carex littledalei]
MEQQQHFILFPFLAQGHTFPFLNLAKQLEQHTRKHDNNTIITLVSTPLNVAKLRNSISETSCIKLAEIPFSATSHGIQAGIESTESISLNQFDAFFEATETSLQPPFEDLIASLINQGQTKICIIADYFLGWTVEVAEKYNISHAVFATGGPYGMAVMFSLAVNPPPPSFYLRASPNEMTTLVDYPEVQVPYSDVVNIIAPLDRPINAFVRRQLLCSFRSHAVLLNSSEELDKQGIRLLRSYPSLPLYTIGPLVRERSLCSLTDNNSEEEQCINFLDSKRPNSVLYISFGSQNTIHALQMIELAKGLAASGRPFLWVIRPPSEFEDEFEGEFREEWLPKGFKANISQKAQGILLHNHCGWNSVLESLYEGVPIIGWPLSADQLYTSSMLQDMGAAIEIARGRYFGGLEKGWQGVKDAVEAILDEEKGCGSKMREKVGEIRDVIRAAVRDDTGFVGSSCKAMESFLQAIFDG